MKLLLSFKKFIHSDSKLITYYQFVRLGSNIFLSVIFSRFFFESHQLSQYEAIILTISSFVFFWNAGFVRFFQSTYNNHDIQKHNQFIHQLLNTSFIVGIFTALVFLLVIQTFDLLSLLISCKIITSVVTNPLEYYNIAQKKYQKVFLLINFYFFIFIFWTIYHYVNQHFDYMLVGWVVLDIIKLILLNNWFSYRWRILEKPFFLSLIYLSLSAFLSGGVEYINSWLVKTYYSDLEFIIYRYGAREIPFSALLAYGLSASLTAQIRNQKLPFNTVKNKITQLLHITFPITIVLLFVSKPLFQFLYGDTLLRSAKIFDIFLLLNISRVMIFDIFLLANQKHSFFLITSLIEILTVITISFIGINFHWKVEHMAFSIFIAYFVERVILAIKLKSLNIKIEEFYPIQWWFFYTAIIIGVFFIKQI